MQQMISTGDVDSIADARQIPWAAATERERFEKP